MPATTEAPAASRRPLPPLPRPPRPRRRDHGGRHRSRRRHRRRCRTNVSELDADATIDINPQPRDSLQQGGTLRLQVASLAENWNPNHPDGNERDFSYVLQPMTYFPWLIDNEGVATLNPTTCSSSPSPTTTSR